MNEGDSESEWMSPASYRPLVMEERKSLGTAELAHPADEAKLYEIEFPCCSVFETPPHAAQSIRGWVLGECNVDLLRFLGPLGA